MNYATMTKAQLEEVLKQRDEEITTLKPAETPAVEDTPAALMATLREFAGAIRQQTQMVSAMAQGMGINPQAAANQTIDQSGALAPSHQGYQGYQDVPPGYTVAVNAHGIGHLVPTTVEGMTRGKFFNQPNNVGPVVAGSIGSNLAKGALQYLGGAGAKWGVGVISGLFK